MTFMTGIAVMLGIGAVVSVMMVIEAINTRAGQDSPRAGLRAASPRSLTGRLA